MKYIKIFSLLLVIASVSARFIPNHHNRHERKISDSNSLEHMMPYQELHMMPNLDYDDDDDDDDEDCEEHPFKVKHTRKESPYPYYSSTKDPSKPSPTKEKITNLLSNFKTTTGVPTSTKKAIENKTTQRIISSEQPIIEIATTSTKKPITGKTTPRIPSDELSIAEIATTSTEKSIEDKTSPPRDEVSKEDVTTTSTQRIPSSEQPIAETTKASSEKPIEDKTSPPRNELFKEDVTTTSTQRIPSSEQPIAETTKASSEKPIEDKTSPPRNELFKEDVTTTSTQRIPSSKQPIVETTKTSTESSTLASTRVTKYCYSCKKKQNIMSNPVWNFNNDKVYNNFFYKFRALLKKLGVENQNTST